MQFALSDLGHEFGQFIGMAYAIFLFNRFVIRLPLFIMVLVFLQQPTSVIGNAVESRGLGNVVFQPYQPWQRLGESLTVPDVHLITLQPRMEGLIVPSKFYSAAAAGRPTLYVGDSKGEIARLLSKHSSGFTIEPGDVQGLVQTIERLSSDPVLYRKMAANARTAFEENFEQSKSVDAWCKVLEEVCG